MATRSIHNINLKIHSKIEGINKLHINIFAIKNKKHLRRYNCEANEVYRYHPDLVRGL
jgi:hypothetical protein